MTSGADRERRRRQRMAAGRIVLPIEVDEVGLAEGLIDVGLLSATQADDRTALQRAVERLLRMTFGANASP